MSQQVCYKKRVVETWLDSKETDFFNLRPYFAIQLEK